MRPISLSDAELLTETVRAAGAERQSTADLLVLLAEVDRRKLYLCRGYPSLFAFCTRALHFSEPAAYSRIAAARTARQFPEIFTLLANGDVTLTTVTLLSAHLTADNHEALLTAARHKGKRDVERLVAILDPQLPVASSVRRLRGHSAPVTRTTTRDNMTTGVELIPAAGTKQGSVQLSPASSQLSTTAAHPVPAESGSDTLLRPPRTLGVEPVRPVVRTLSPGRAVITPINADQYVLRITINEETRMKLDRIRDLLRHAIPDGDPAAIIERALSLLLEKLQKSRYSAGSRQRATVHDEPAGGDSNRRSRYVSAAVKRAVWARDGGRCAFIGTDGRCAETGFLEFHHVVPYAAGGSARVENLELRCRAHNGLEADKYFDAATVTRRRAHSQSQRTLSGQSSSTAMEPSG